MVRDWGAGGLIWLVLCVKHNWTPSPLCVQSARLLLEAEEAHAHEMAMLKSVQERSKEHITDPAQVCTTRSVRVCRVCARWFCPAIPFFMA